jgi:hypothetical protein
MQNRTIMTMRIFPVIPLLLIFFAPSAGVSQTAAAAGAVSAPSTLLQPAIRDLRQTLSLLQPDKWKLPGPIHDETSADIESIRRDVESTLPPLLANADASPDSATRLLPVLRNIDALYEVLLRVTERAQLTAPQPQSAALVQSGISLEGVRRAFGGRLQDVAAAAEKQVRDLQGTVKAQQVQIAAATSAPAPTPVPCTPPVRTKPKPKASAKAAPKPSTTPTPPAATTKP